MVGNEDGGHKIIADLFQALNDVGYTIPAQGGVYWSGEAMTGTDYRDLDSTPQAVQGVLTTMTANAVHLGRWLAQEGYPAAS